MHSKSQNQRYGTLQGVVLITNTDGSRLPPQSSTVYVMYSRQRSAGAMGSAGDVYLSEQLKIVKSMVQETSKKKHESAKESELQRADEFARYYLESVDGALEATTQWTTKNHKEWQMIRTATSASGYWSVDGLQPGFYKIIVRGKSSGLDAEWEAGLDVVSGETASVQLSKVRMARNLSQ